MLSNGRSAALLGPTAEVDWWCAPDFDSPPLLWSLLDAGGAAARWREVRLVERSQAARALCVLDAAALRSRFGPAALWSWRFLRYARLRWSRQ